MSSRGMSVKAAQRGTVMMSPDFTGTAVAEPGLLPPAEVIVEAGAFGAAMGGVGTGIATGIAVRSGEMTVKEAARDVARNSVNGALTMSVATVVAHMVRARPMLGVGIVAVLGLGALALLRRKPAAAEQAEGAAP